MMYMVFLVCYSYMCLFGIRQTPTAMECVMLAWIFTFACEQFRSVSAFDTILQTTSLNAFSWQWVNPELRHAYFVVTGDIGPCRQSDDKVGIMRIRYSAGFPYLQWGTCKPRGGESVSTESRKLVSTQNGYRLASNRNETGIFGDD